MTQQAPMHAVAWRAPETFLPKEILQSEFNRFLLQANVADKITGHEVISLLHLDNFTNLNDLISAYETNKKPTLFVVNTDDQEAEVISNLWESVDVCKANVSSSVVAARLSRLYFRSQSHSENIQHRDSHTGLLNRFALKDDFDKYSKSDLVLSGDSRAIVYLDLDNFKPINDRYGHEVGDEVLREVAKLLLAQVGPADGVYRVGGDEFVILLSRYNTQTLLDEGERLRKSISDHDFKPSEGIEPIKISASIGVTILDPHSQLEDSIRQADMAMYQAKRQGGDRVVCFTATDDDSTSINQDIHVQHFENVTRVVTGRVTELITQLGRRLIEAAREEANNDALTKLNNRRYFDSRLSREFELAKKHGRDLTIAFMDIDNFHDVNTIYGWPTGDHILRTFSQIAQENIRLVDWLARYGGEEFCLVMLDTDLEQGLTVAERIRNAVAKSNVQSLDHRPVKLTVSIGVAKLSDEVDTPVALVQKASKALIKAKGSGRNRVCHDDNIR